MRKLILIFLMIASNPAFAFDMNPIDVDCWGNMLFCKTLKLTERLKYPVHETMTLLAYDVYETPEEPMGGSAKTSTSELKKRGILRDLVLGSEWNDDPDGLLRQGITKSLYWYVLFNDAKLQAECNQTPTLPNCQKVSIEKNPMMLYRSHFGDLQFIHSMASSESETAETTKQKMMAWAKFTYQVYVSEENLENEALDGEKIRAFSNIADLIQRSGWTVGALFDPKVIGKWERSYNPRKYGHFVSNGNPRTQNDYSRSPDEKISIRHVALGSLLHMIQDSYSDSHAERKNGCNPLAKSKGNIISFRNYIAQKPEDHGLADLHPEWLEKGTLKTNNPLWASAQIIQWAFNNESWDSVVEPFLENEVFELNNSKQLPKPGSRDCFSGRR